MIKVSIFMVTKNKLFVNILDLNAQDNAGNTPLHVAVENEALDAVDFLLSV